MPSRRKKKTRYFLVLLGLSILVGALVLVKALQVSLVVAMGKQAEVAGQPPEAVASAVAREQSWEQTLSAVGTIAGKKSVEVSNDAPGRVARIRFESGAVVPKGRVLVELDASVERAQLESAKARRDLARVNANRSRALVAAGGAPKAQLDTDEAALDAANAEVETIQSEIDRKVVRAPFDGRLGIRAVDVGQYVAPGTTLTTLEQTGAVFVDFSLPQERFGAVREGMPVRVTTQGAPKIADEGVVTAVDPTIDEATRSIRLRATIPNEGDALRPGMFVDVRVVLPELDRVVTVPATAIVHASFGDSVFVIEDKKAGSPGMSKTPQGKPVRIARQRFVRTGQARGDFVVIEAGLNVGQEVVTAGAFKLRNGAAVVVDNSVRPEPQLEPHPENR